MKLKTFFRGVMKSGKLNGRSIISMCAAELLGTAFYIFFGCMGDVYNNSIVVHFQYSFAFGLALVAIYTSFGHISQSHLNPAVTICAACYGSLPLLMVPLYFLSQLIGCILGFGILKAILPGTLYVDDLCVTTLGSEVTWLQGFVIEFFASLIWIFVCCGLWDHRNKSRRDSLPLRLGFAVFCLILVTVRFTGGSMNPVRSFGPAIFNNKWAHHWIYWVAPCLAGVLTTFVYTTFYGGPEAINKVQNIADDNTDAGIKSPLRAEGSIQFINVDN